MPDTALLIDSTTVLPEGYVEQHEVTVIPVPIYFGGKEYRDGVDITEEDFLSLLETLAERPSTAVPGLGEFISYYERLLQERENVVYLVPSLRLSGLFGAAIQAAEQVPGASIVAVDPPEDWQKEVCTVRSSDPRLEDQLAAIRGLTPPVISVVNTGFASGASGLVALAALTAMDEGKALDRVVESMVTAKINSNIFLILATLDYVVDRVGKLRAFLGSLLRIRPILTFQNGYLEDVARVRSMSQAKRRMIEMVQQRVGGRAVDIFVLHTLAPSEAADLLEQGKRELNVRHSWVSGIGASISRYAGRGGLGIAFTELPSDS
jgi:fatty acid-binding protein DegV